MKKLSKVLSLVLVFAMVFSLCVIGASANNFKDYTDAKDVDANYTEAVDVLMGIGMVNGRSATTLAPKANYTRAEAAKLVAYMQLGPTKAESLAGNGAMFTDTLNMWASKYITYCAQQGIITGYGNGKFGPNDALTGYQWAKMCLAAVGYGVNKEYVGNSWSINVAKDGLQKGVFTDVLSASTNAIITREQAMQMCFNTLTGINKVTYSSAIGDYIDGAWMANGVTTTGTLGESVYALYCSNNDTNVTTTKTTVLGEQALNYVAADEAFEVSTTANDGEVAAPDATYTDAGRVGHIWYQMTSKGKVAVSAFYTTDALLGTSTDGTTFAALTTKGNAKFVAAADKAVTYYVNGVEGQMPSFAKGTEVKLFDTNDNGKVDTVIAVEKTTAVVGAAGVKYNSDKTKATVAGIVTAYTSVAALDNFADLVKDDVVLTWKDVTGVTHFQKLEATKGQLSKISYNTAAQDYAYTISGTDYQQSGIALAGLKIADQGYNVDVNYYFDDFGYIVYAKAVKEAASDIVILSAQAGVYQSGLTASYVQGQLVKMDGTTSIVKLVKADGSIAATSVGTDGTLNTPTYAVNSFYYYKVNAAGNYVLTAVPAATANVMLETKSAYSATPADNKEIAVQNNVSAIVNATTPTTGNVTTYANASTVYVYKTALGTYATATGVANAPVATSADGKVISVLYTASGAAAKCVFINFVPTMASVGDTVFFVNPNFFYKHAETVTNKGDGYVEYQAIINAQLTSVKVAPDSQTNPAAPGVAVGEGFYTPTYSNGIINGTSAVALPAQYGIGSGATDASVIMVGAGNSYTWTATTVVCVVTLDKNGYATMETTTVDKIDADVNDTVYVVPVDGQPTAAKAIYIIKNDEPTTTVMMATAGNFTAGYLANATDTTATAYAKTGIYANDTITYEWYVNGVKNAANTYNPSTITVAAGDVVQCQITFLNAVTGASYTAVGSYTVK